MQWYSNTVIDEIGRHVNHERNLVARKKTAINAIEAGANKLLPACACIQESMKDVRYLKTDETQYAICSKCGGRTGYAWGQSEATAAMPILPRQVMISFAIFRRPGFPCPMRSSAPASVRRLVHLIF